MYNQKMSLRSIAAKVPGLRAANRARIAVSNQRRLDADFQEHIRSNRVYFGPLLASAQLNPQRVPWMEKTAALATVGRRAPALLEIGSWAGCSALIWAKAARDAEGTLTCVDMWQPYFDLDVNPNAVAMEQATKNDAVYNLFLHNMKAGGVSGAVRIERLSAAEFLPSADAESFDLVYIDGDHSYPHAKHDISESQRIVKIGGYLCGDDLEVQAADCPPKLLMNAPSGSDTIDLPGGRSFHPGVTRAIYETFRRAISVYDGFWIVRKTLNGWEDVNL